MIIHGTDKTGFIKIERQDCEYAVQYDITASLRGVALNRNSIILVEVERFLSSLIEFEQRRAGRAVLSGTEDFELVIEADGRMGHAWAKFKISEPLYVFSPQTGTGRTGCHSLTGSFPVSGEYLGKVVQDFRELFISGKPL